MACNSAICQSGCNSDGLRRTDNQQSQPVVGTSELSEGVSSRGNIGRSTICIKCKVNQTMAAASTAGFTGEYSFDGDFGRFCGECFRNNLYGKFRFAVTSNGLILPTDNVLVAFSGGPSSRVALQFVHEMQMKAQKNFDASRDRSLPVFGVGVAFVDESSAFAVDSHEIVQKIEEMQLIVSNLGPPVKQFHVLPTGSIYSSDSNKEKDRLKELLDVISDVTGREDVLEYLRMLCFQKVASANGYTKIVLGTCTSRIACHVLEATIKGQGYSLAADIQYVDARWKIPVVLPLHDCLSQELNLLCSVDCLKTVEVFCGPRAGINGLVSSFVKLLQEENPSRESTIVRTAGKLTPFQFNRMPEADDCDSQLASQRRQKKYNLKINESLPPESFCPICKSPLKKSDFKSYNEVENGKISVEIIKDTCCSSCQFQILPKESSSLEKFFVLLPHPMVDRAEYGSSEKDQWLREQIQDFLISDEDGA